jgi:hypothetical protein
VVRWIFAAVLLVVGIGAFLSDRAQKSEEREDLSKAIKKTAEDVANDIAPRVASQTSAKVTDALNAQYGSAMSGLYQQIGELEGPIASPQGRTGTELYA